MKLSILFVSAMFLSIPTVFGQAAGSTEASSRLSDLFDAGSAGGLSGILATLKSGKAPAPTVSAPVEDALSHETHFTSLMFSVFNSFTQTTITLQLNETGNAMVWGSDKRRHCAALSSEQVARLRFLWETAHLGLGEKQIGRPIMDSPQFTLSYGFCGDSFHMCGKGSIKGALMPSAWGEDKGNIEPLIQYLMQLERQLNQNPIVF